MAQSRRTFARSRTMSFLAMTKSIAQIASNYMNGEQLACDTWSNYINKSHIPMEDAISFLRLSIARKHSTAHIIYTDDGSMAGISSEAHADDKADFSVSYRNMDLFPSLETRNDGIRANITRAFTNPMNGRQSIAFYNKIVLREGDKDREALLLRIVPLDTLRNSWVFPTESYKDAEISLIDSDGDYIIKGKSFKNSNFFEFYKSYNAPDYGMQQAFYDNITGENGTTTMRNSRGEDWLIAHAVVNSASDWMIISSLPEDELKERSFDLPLVIIISCGLVLMIVFNLITLMMFNRQLALTAEAEKAANRAKSDFLSVMSHDIRTPINAVLGLDEMILRESGSPVIQGYASDIQSSGKMLLGLINDILDFSKIEAGKMEIVTADYDEGDVMADLVNIISPRAQAKDLSFIVNADASMPCLLRGDDTRIKQCTLNLLTNAVKYTHAGSVTLDIGWEKADDSHIIIKTRVTDTGIGIKEEDLKKLCSPYERIEESRNRNIEGTGLGMSIVTKLLAAMGSSLVVKSVYGKGSVFSFDVMQEVRGWKELGDWREHREEALQSVEHYKESFQAPGAGILIVDDTPMNLTVVKALLKATRIQIETAADAMTALEKARDRKFDVILADHLMPQMGGLEMLQKLRADPGSVNRNTVCIALTANAMNGAREMYLAAGFADYVTKPIDAAKLEAVLQKYLPAELVLHEGDEGYVAAAGDAGHASHDADPLVYELFGIDSAEALHNCGGTETFIETLRIFSASIEENAKKIEAFAAAGDWHNYTILVHALKSSARLIGAAKLSEDAKKLEALGNAARGGADGTVTGADGTSGNTRAVTGASGSAGTGTSGADGAGSAAAAVAEIRKLTPALLAAYRAYAPRLRPLCGGESGGAAGEGATASGGQGGNQADRPDIDAGMFSSAVSALKKALEGSDFAYAEEVLAGLDAYTLPPGIGDTFQKIREAVGAGDRDAALALL